MDGPNAEDLAGLMRAAQPGDKQAYARALKACVPLIGSVARRAGVKPHYVDDVVQDTLVTIHRALPTYDPDRPFGPWLRAIASRRAIDSMRVHGRHGAREVQDEVAYLQHAEPGADAEVVVSRDDDAARLRKAVATLPPLQRQAVELLALSERSLEQASQETGRSKVALKVNLHRALRALRTRVRLDDA